MDTTSRREARDGFARVCRDVTKCCNIDSSKAQAICEKMSLEFCPEDADKKQLFQQRFPRVMNSLIERLNSFFTPRLIYMPYEELVEKLQRLGAYIILDRAFDRSSSADFEDTLFQRLEAIASYVQLDQYFYDATGLLNLKPRADKMKQLQKQYDLAKLSWIFRSESSVASFRDTERYIKKAEFSLLDENRRKVFLAKLLRVLAATMSQELIKIISEGVDKVKTYIPKVKWWLNPEFLDELAFLQLDPLPQLLTAEEIYEIPCIDPLCIDTDTKSQAHEAITVVEANIRKSAKEICFNKDTNPVKDVLPFEKTKRSRDRSHDVLKMLLSPHGSDNEDDDAYLKRKKLSEQIEQRIRLRAIASSDDSRKKSESSSSILHGAFDFSARGVVKQPAFCKDEDAEKIRKPKAGSLIVERLLANNMKNLKNKNLFEQMELPKPSSLICLSVADASPDGGQKKSDFSIVKCAGFYKDGKLPIC